MNVENHPALEWAVATRPLEGQVESGDHYIAQPFETGILVGAVDGLGHGREAADAARLAVAALSGRAREPLIPLVRYCHEVLKHTRGVVMSLASLDTSMKTLTWLAVGNVEGLLLRADLSSQPPYEEVLPRAGVVGYQLPQLRAEIVPIMLDDLLIFATDGIQGDLRQGLNRALSPQQIADGIMARSRKATDDALVLVVRYRGGGV